MSHKTLFRIAPTPSGFLHQGNLINFLCIWVIARAHGARILLRIDDLDTERIRPAYVDDIFRSIDDLGINYDLGPQSAGDLSKVWSQRHRRDLYQNLFDRLKAGGCVYPSSLSRRATTAILSAGGSWPAIRQMAPNSRYVCWRYAVRAPCATVPDWNGDLHPVHLPDSIGDVIVIRQDGVPAYQLASVADDVHFGVTHVVRGQDLLPSTAVQLLIAGDACLSAFSTIRWWHHGLLKNADGAKLSKSAGASAQPLNIKACLPDLIAQTARTLGLDLRDNGCSSPDDLLKLYAATCRIEL